MEQLLRDWFSLHDMHLLQTMDEENDLKRQKIGLSILSFRDWYSLVSS